MAKNQKVSVITVCYNAALHIEKTILSVLSQTYDQVEYIIVDGGSNDGTTEIIQKYQNRIDKYISEPDNGIFDAMNKGVALASGDWINFMNAGDLFYNEEVLKAIFSQQVEGYEFIYGDFQLMDDQKLINRKNRPLAFLHMGMRRANICHQATLVKRNLQTRHPFNTAFRVSSDFEFIYTIFQEGARFYKYKGFIARYLRGGFSTDMISSNRKRDYQIVSRYSRNPLVKVYFMLSLLKVWLRQRVKVLLNGRC